MVKRLTSLWTYFLDYILPQRSDFNIVKRLDEKDIENLPKARDVQDLDWIHPLFNYKDNKVRAIIWELKYKNNTRVLYFIGRGLFEEIIYLISDLALFNNDAGFLLIPIPITSNRRRERGYNQSEYIAKAIIENDLDHNLIYAPQFLSKVKETQRQSHSVSKEERQRNLSGCFAADSRVEGKFVILIDDVVTTGATLSEAKKTLLEKGARDVYAFTIAH